MERRGTAVFRHMRVIVTEKTMAYGVRGRAAVSGMKREALERAYHRGEEDGMTDEEAQRAGKERDREKEGRDREDGGRVEDGGDDAPPDRTQPGTVGVEFEDGSAGEQDRFDDERWRGVRPRGRRSGMTYVPVDSTLVAAVTRKYTPKLVCIRSGRT